jgi:hypothetical protein
MPDVKTLYDEDFVTWLESQAAALRAAGRSGSNQEIDWENLAEEIEGLARSERRELRSRLAVIVEHLVKLEHSPAQDPRNDWVSTVRRERMDIELLLEDSPSLAREIPDMIRKEIRHGVENAAMALERCRELNASLQQAIKTKAYLDLFAYTPDQILGDWLPPEPPP